MLADALFSRRHQKTRWLFILAATPLSLFALTGIAYGAFLLYAIPAALCFIQFFYPTLFVWGLVLALSAFAMFEYGYLLLLDIYRITDGNRAEVLQNPYDSFGFLLLFGIIVVVFFGLAFSRPVPFLSEAQQNQSESTNA